LAIFETFKKYFPTVVCIEGGMMLHPYCKRVEKEISKQEIHQSLNTMVKSFKDRGYKILCSSQDAFFIKEELYNKFNVENNLLKLYFNGLRALPRRMPHIYEHLKKMGLRNEFVDYILRKSSYNGSWRPWAKKRHDKILLAIDKKEKIELLKERNNKNIYD